METNRSFSIQRFLLLCKQSLIINKKLIAISLAGFTGTLFIGLILLQAQSDFRTWDPEDYMVLFFLLFFTLGVIYSSLSFPAFRSKEKSMAYLMLSTSSSEKFVFELLTRIVLFILVIPLLFWLVASLESALVQYYVPGFGRVDFLSIKSEGNYTITYHDVVTNHGKLLGWPMFAMVQGGLFVFIAAFTGASHFSKSPLLKTLFIFSMLVAGYALFTILLFKGLNLREYEPVNHRVLFITNEHDAIALLAIGITAVNLCFLAIAFFRLKEKEV